MYNRYVPNPNGSYERHRVPSPPPASQASRSVTPQAQKAGKPEPPAAPQNRSQTSQKPQAGHMKPAPSRKPAFLENFDSGDLLVLLILLLILKEGEEDTLTLLLTIGAFFLFQSPSGNGTLPSGSKKAD